MLDFRLVFDSSLTGIKHQHDCFQHQALIPVCKGTCLYAKEFVNMATDCGGIHMEKQNGYTPFISGCKND